MEIVSWVLSGALEHRDSEGNRGVITAGEVQVMSAGTGITHAEYNPSATDPVHFLQIWIRPRRRGHPPRWEQRAVTGAGRGGRLVPVVSGSASGTLAIDQDATIYIGALAPGQTAAHTTAAGRRIYLYVIDGDARLDGDALAAGDQARITDLPRLDVEALTPTELLLIDLP
jgi:redox-sensitive bicupin YhaK (pirin superfamily)